MKLINVLIPVLSVIGAVSARLNTTREFKLVTKVKPGQSASKKRFGGLYLSAYHSGAALNDAVLLKNASSGISGFLNKTNPVLKQPNGKAYYNLEFDLGNDFPYAAQISYPNSYVEWYPIEINAGDKSSTGAWFFNKTGLQYDQSPGQKDAVYDGFGGWLVCDWWRGVPQLFMRSGYYNATKLANCADVYLLRKYT